MFKRPYILAILIVAFVTSVLLVNTNAGNKAQKIKIQSKSSNAQRLWENSAHADKTAEAFNHWNEEGSIPVDCARCHSTPGFQDYIGADGSAVDSVESEAPLGTTVECQACHADPENGVLRDRTYVTFPSGAKVEDLGPEALCMTCHQGRESSKSIDKAIADSGVTDDDTVSSKLKFINIHYYAAAATQFGKVAMGGYQYEGKSYDARFAHVPGYNACFICHNSHSLEVDMESCNTCHTGIEDPKNIRFYGSFVDYDGDGNITEGMYYEIETFKDMLFTAIQRYAREIVGKPLAYDELTYPYFFNDNNNNGVVDSNEADYANSYKSFTARLQKASYNFQVAMKDPNSFAHNGKYIIELLYDSLEDLNSKLGGSQPSSITRPRVNRSRPATQEMRSDKKNGNPAASRAMKGTGDLKERNLNPNNNSASSLARTDEGHFDGSGEPWRHWDEDGEVLSSCAKCHSAEGLPYFLENGKVDKSMPIANGMLCITCHTTPPLLRFAGPVTFPSGAVKDLADESNLCLNCHQGRESKKSVDKAIAAGAGPYEFTNIHYYAAAASFFGSEVQGGYEFAGKTYVGRNPFPNHNGLFTDCVECHFSTKSFNRKQDDSDALFHNTAPSKEDCVFCHGQDVSQPHPGADAAKFEFGGIRPANMPDFDGDNNSGESLKDELKGLESALFSKLLAYGESIGAPLVYDADAYPYFFKDKNGNGVADSDELEYANRYKFTAPMLRAAYNFQMSKKEPCGYIHNPRYIAQLLVDSIGHLGGNIKAYTWR